MKNRSTSAVMENLSFINNSQNSDDRYTIVNGKVFRVKGIQMYYLIWHDTDLRRVMLSCVICDGSLSATKLMHIFNPKMIV